MEPNYVGPNGRINAMAVAELFANDFAFFNPDEISWDGRHHAMTGIQFNAVKIDEYPVFVEHVANFVPGIGDLLATIEQDEELIVPRSKIARGLHEALREGDLTGITLFNLQACGRALWIQPDGEDYKVFVDTRVGLGIPGLYRLVARMIEDMRAYNEIEGTAKVMFFSTRNFDANEYLGDVTSEVEGAEFESIHVEEIGGPGGVASTADATAVDGECEDQDDEDQDEAMLSVVLDYALQVLGASDEDPDSPVACFMDRACNEKVDADELAQLIVKLGLAFNLPTAQMATHARDKFVEDGGDPDSLQCVLMTLLPLVALNGRVEPFFGKLLDVYDVQVRCGASTKERKTLLDALDEFGKSAFTSSDDFAESGALLDALGVEWFNDEGNACFDRLKDDRKQLKKEKRSQKKSKAAAADAGVQAVAPTAEVAGEDKPADETADSDRDTLRSVRDYLAEQAQVCKPFSAHAAEVLGDWAAQLDAKLDRPMG